jgi:hypothetical protein
MIVDTSLGRFKVTFEDVQNDGAPWEETVNNAY